MNRRSNPAPTWEAYEQGRLVSPVGSPSSPSQISASSTSAIRPIRASGDHAYSGNLTPRSSFGKRISSIRQAGGVNSIENFARSIQRAAVFHEIGRRSSFIYTDDDDSEAVVDEEQGAPRPPKGLIRQQIEQYGVPGTPSETVDEESSETQPLMRQDAAAIVRTRPSHLPIDQALPPHLWSALSESYGTSFGTISSRPSADARRRASILIQEREEAEAQLEPDKEREPLIAKKVQLEDGTHTTIVVGRSTVPQTVFNSVNTLIGVGLLSLPLGIRYAGWVVGMVFLLFAAVVTQYTAKLLAYCLDVDRSFVNYSDVAFISFGNRARAVVSALFSLELIAANVALIVLFADSLNVLIPGFKIWEWKIFCGFILVPLNFVPLRYLAVTSVLGILCCTGLVVIVFVDGFLKPNSPGSLRQPAKTYALPATWGTLPLSFGLLMSPWGGHSVFPNIYRDMRHPMKYGQALNYIYVSTYSILAAMAVGGYLMFGEQVRDEITANLLLTTGYPRFLSFLTVVFIAIVPLTKVPLSCAPIISALEVQLSLDPRAIPPSSPYYNNPHSPLMTAILESTIRVGILALTVAIAILFPDFDTIMALMGSCLCFTICVILPVAFYLKTFAKEVKARERILCWILMILCSIMAVLGTVSACLPKDMLGIL